MCSMTDDLNFTIYKNQVLSSRGHFSSFMVTMTSLGLEKSNKIDAFCEANGLKRDHSRELVSEQYTKVISVDNDGKSGIINKEDDAMGLSVEKVDFIWLI